MSKKQKQLEEEYAELLKHLDAVVRAVEAGDSTAMEQTAGAGREFLDTHTPKE